MTSLTIVLDINGVLANVRKKSDGAPDGVEHDLVIPSGQRVYMRPHLLEFCNYLHNITRDNPGIKVVMWTSRKRVNAEPIERYLSDKYRLDPFLYLHGEDCEQLSGFHPVKDSEILKRKMRYNAGHVVFVDDAPERIKLDCHSETLGVNSYDAAKPDSGGGLINVICALARLVERVRAPVNVYG